MKLERFHPQSFINRQVKEIKKTIGDERALIAVSGGVDSTTSAVLTHHAIKENLLCVMLDDAFMREGEPEMVHKLLSKHPLYLPIRILDVKGRFLSKLKGMNDAEEKRKAFRETFYRVLNETAEVEGCSFLVQGTIYADILETTGGIKTQHNVLSQVGINPVERYGFLVVEPLATLYKEQVREVARQLGVPLEISERQPFPGPGLSVRVIGKIKVDKLETLRKATVIAEEKFAEHRPDQYFAAVLENREKIQPTIYEHVQRITAQFLGIPAEHIDVKTFQDKATGVKAGERRYGDVAAIKAQIKDGLTYQPTIKNLVALQAKVIAENPSLTRILYMVQKKPVKQPYVIAMRAIQTRDFLTARVSEIPWTTLRETAQEILKVCPDVSSVYYDVTPKPPATIEME